MFYIAPYRVMRSMYSLMMALRPRTHQSLSSISRLSASGMASNAWSCIGRLLFMTFNDEN
jgi:hypothetical protein